MQIRQLVSQIAPRYWRKWLKRVRSDWQLYHSHSHPHININDTNISCVLDPISHRLCTCVGWIKLDNKKWLIFAAHFRFVLFLLQHCWISHFVISNGWHHAFTKCSNGTREEFIDLFSIQYLKCKTICTLGSSGLFTTFCLIEMLIVTVVLYSNWDDLCLVVMVCSLFYFPLCIWLHIISFIIEFGLFRSTNPHLSERLTDVSLM